MLQPVQRRQQIGKTLALHKDVFPQELRGKARLASEDRVDDTLVLIE